MSISDIQTGKLSSHVKFRYPQHEQNIDHIYFKADTLDQQLHTKAKINRFPLGQVKPVHFCLPVDRENQIAIQRMRQQKKQVNRNTVKRLAKANTNKDRPSSILHFLSCSKDVTRSSETPSLRRSGTRQLSESHIKKTLESQFTPLGATISDTQQEPRTPMSSGQLIHSRQLGTTNQKQRKQPLSSQKYLRKKSRLRSILLQQMNCPERLHIETDSPLAYLKEYDEWLPVPLVDQRRGELNKLMSILYGDKRTQSALHVDLNTVTPIYL